MRFQLWKIKVSYLQPGYDKKDRLKNRRVLGLFYGLCWQNTVTTEQLYFGKIFLRKGLGVTAIWQACYCVLPYKGRESRFLCSPCMDQNSNILLNILSWMVFVHKLDQCTQLWIPRFMQNLVQGIQLSITLNFLPLCGHWIKASSWTSC